MIETKGGIMSEGTGRFLLLQNKYSKLLSRADNLNKLFTVMDGKFKFSAREIWKKKIAEVSSDIIIYPTFRKMGTF